MEVSQITKVEVFPAGRYSARELRNVLAKHRQSPVPTRTLQWWRMQLNIRPGIDRFYGESDLQLLIGLVKWLRRGGTVDGFKVLHNINTQSEGDSTNEQRERVWNNQQQQQQWTQGYRTPQPSYSDGTTIIC